MPADADAIGNKAEDDIGDSELGRRRGFRGGRLFSATQSLLSFKSPLSPLSPLFPPGPTLRHVSSRIGLRQSSPALNEDGVTNENAFAMHGDPFYVRANDASPANIYDLSVYDCHPPENIASELAMNNVCSSKPSLQTRQQLQRPSMPKPKPKSKPKPKLRLKPKLKIYETSIYDVGIELGSIPASRTTGPASLTTVRDKNWRFKVQAEKHQTIYEASENRSCSSLPLSFVHGMHSCSSSLVALNSRDHKHTSAALLVAIDSEQLEDVEYLRSIAHAHFSPTTTPRSSLSSVFHERRQSCLRSLVLPQQVVSAQSRPNSVSSNEGSRFGSFVSINGIETPLSEPRNESDVRRSALMSIQAQQYSGQLEDITSRLHCKGDDLRWDIDLENGSVVEDEESRMPRVSAV